MFSTKTKLDRRSRQIQYIAQYTSDIRYIAGSRNQIANALSHLEINVVSTPVTYEDIARMQIQDEKIQNIRKNGFRD